MSGLPGGGEAAFGDRLGANADDAWQTRFTSTSATTSNNGAAGPTLNSSALRSGTPTVAAQMANLACMASHLVRCTQPAARTMSPVHQRSILVRRPQSPAERPT
jgi:hypothetical protein